MNRKMIVSILAKLMLLEGKQSLRTLLGAAGEPPLPPKFL